MSSATWTCRGCGAVLPTTVATCLHAIDVPRPSPITQKAAPPRPPSASSQEIAAALRDVADLVAVHRLSLPEALRRVASKLDGCA